MKAIKIVMIVVAALGLASCSVANQAKSAYNMVNCNYDYRSISDLTLAGVNVSKGLSIASSLQLAAKLSNAGTTFPVGMTVNLDVQNPNQSEAMLNGLDYILSIDDIQFTTGSVDQQLAILAGGTGSLPLTMVFDIATLLTGDSRDAVAGIVKNMAGINSEPSKVTLSIRPAFNVGGYKVTSPVYIPISFSFGGK